MHYTTPNSEIGSIFGTTQEELETPVKSSDRTLLVCVFMLMIFGSMAVYSSIAFFAQTHGTTAGSLVTGHIVKLGIALFVMLFVSKLSYRVIAKFSRIAVVISWILLIAVMIYGDLIFGARRSLTVGAFSFQPSSLASISLILHVSVLLQEKQDYIQDFKRSFLPIMVWISVTCLLVAIEDFSSAAILMGICVILLFIGRINTVQIFGVLLIGLLGGAALISSSEERQSRISEYVTQVIDINNQNLESDNGYQAQQAYIAIAQGKFAGVGAGKSTQRDFLPAPYNDFIFAIIAEEYGMVGASTIILIFIVIFYRGIAVIARNSQDVLGTLLAAGATLMITLFGFVNAAVATGLLPVTGLPMPFVSYGGTSMFFSGMMVGLLLNISKYNRNPKNRFYNG